MPENVLSSINRMEEALGRIPREDAERLAEAAAVRAEAVAEYAEQIGRTGDSAIAKISKEV